MRSGGDVSLDLPDGTTLPAGSMITACFNDTCVSSTLSTSLTPSSDVAIGFPYGSGVYGTFDHDRMDVQSFVQDGTPCAPVTVIA